MASGEAKSPVESAAGKPATRVLAFPRARAALRYGLVLCALAGVVALSIGFVWFVHRVPTDVQPADRTAEGIVVLTGGAARINDAVELLAAGRGQRLLITGVNRTTHSRELARLTPHYQALFGCCIDLDHSAQNTIGNAVETRRWTRARGFHSLLVVTSAYHMPRAIAELSHELPDVKLIEFPVLTDRQRSEPWWSNGVTARLIITEYFKFIAAVVRMHVLPARETEGELARRCCAPA
ncbi:MAG TPA: YdcF family protein [Xanthobacteraceae bacterium]